jgi:hypothetical protein
MNEYVVSKAILNCQGKAIEQRIVFVPSALIHVMRGEGNLLPHRLIIKHQQSSIEMLEFVVP